MNSLQDLTEKKRTFFDTEPTVRVDPIIMPLPRREPAERRQTDGMHAPRGAMPPPFPPRSRSVAMAAIAPPSPGVPASPVESAAPSTPGTLDVEEATRMFERTETTAKRWRLPMLAGIAAGLVGIVVPIVCLLSTRGSGSAASLAPALAAPSSTSVLIALPISSAPAGASVTLIGDGTATVVGRTPLTVALDPSHAYDIVIALRGHKTTMMHISPHETKVVAVALTTLH